MPVLPPTGPCSAGQTFRDDCCGLFEQGGVRHAYLVDQEYARITLRPALLVANALLPNQVTYDAAVIAAFDAARASNKAIKISDVIGTGTSTNDVGEGYGDNETEVQGAMASIEFDTFKYRNNLGNVGYLNGTKNYVVFYTTEGILHDSLAPVTVEVTFDLKTKKEKAILKFKTTWRIPRNNTTGAFQYPEQYVRPAGLFACSDEPNMVFLNTTSYPTPPPLKNWNFAVLFDKPCAGGGNLTLASVSHSVDGNITASFDAINLFMPANQIANFVFPVGQLAVVNPGELTFTFQTDGCDGGGAIDHNVKVTI